MEIVDLPGYIEAALNIVALKKNFKTPTFDFNEGSNKGFIGLIKKCKISENGRALSVMCKFLPTDEERNRKFDSYELFKREVIVYQEFLPELESIQIEHGLTFRDDVGFWSYPRCFLSDYNAKQPEKSFIIMEDLTEDNYITKCEFQTSDFPHTLKLFIELGKFHAISFALRCKKPEIFDRFKSLGDTLCRTMMTPVMKNLAPRNCQLAADLFNRPEELKIRDKILSYKNNLWSQMEEILVGEKAEPYAVICHGDCWINNVMYNYEDKEEKQIKNIRLVDWQMTKFGSAAAELMYYIFCCTDKALRDQHQSELLEAYYDSMKTILQRFNLDVNRVFPFSKLQEQLKTFGKIAFAMATFAMPLMHKYPQKLFDDKNAKLTNDEEASLALYKTTMRDIVIDLIKMDVL